MQQQVTADQAIQIAIQHHQAGRFPEAEAIYRQVLGVQPDRFDALHLLGVLAHQVGRSDASVELIRRAITLLPDFAEAHYNLGNALMVLGKFQQAKVAFARAIELKPDYAEAHNNLGNSLIDVGKLDEAAAAYSKAIQISPGFADARYNLANIHKNRGRFDEAIAGYVAAIQLKGDYPEAYSHLADALRVRGRLNEAASACAKAIEQKPASAEAHNNLGNILRDQGKLAEAIAAYSKAVELKPDVAGPHYNLGKALIDQGKQEEGIAAYSRAIALNADFVEAHYNLGNALAARGKLDEAVTAYSSAVRLEPDHADAHSNLASALKNQGLLDEALASYDRAIALKPENAPFGSNRVYTVHFHPGYGAPMLHQEHKRWNAQHAARLAPLKRAGGTSQATAPTERRLKIGYVSADLYAHGVGRFLLPILERRDRGGFEVFWYSNVRDSDPMTGQFKALVDNWQDIAGVTDEQAADLVRKDKIDILVDLAMHTPGNRMLLFARRPAPVQATYPAYCSTTGLETIDYRLTDPLLDPPGSGDEPYSEKSIRLPETCWCYQPITTMEVGSLPALSSGQVTFGCLNDFAKVTAPALAAWGRVLRDTPQSRLLLHAPQGSPRQRALYELKREGVEPDRVTFVDQAAGRDYFKLFQSIDIALDPFPFGGAMTTCDAIWMGVPVVTLAGKTAVGRAGASILSNVGLAGLVARAPERYVRVAAELAKDLTRLAKLRASLRTRVQKSPLMDAGRLTRNLESAYRQMWRESSGG